MPLTKLQEAALNGDKQEWERLRKEEYQRRVNSPVRKPGLAITPEQKEIIQSHLESGDIPAAQEIIIGALDQWSRDNPPRNFNLTWSTGIIRRYFQDKAYGFIRPDDNGLDVWVHKKFCAEGYTPTEGDKVIYLTRLGDEGSLVAKEVNLNQEVTDSIGQILDSFKSGIDAGPIGSQDYQQAVQDHKQSMYDVIYGKRS